MRRDSTFKPKRRACVCAGALKAPRSTPHALQAFTLVELMVVIVVIAILAGITIPLSRYALQRAKEARREVMLAELRSALDDYRATYGEYPITGNPDYVKNHYQDNVPTECATTGNSPFTNVNLITDGTVDAHMSLGSTPVNVDYSLTYPLMIRRIQEGKTPFYVFPNVTVMTLVYKRPGDDSDVWHQTVKNKQGELKELWGLRGNPINRPLAVDPVTHQQWKYSSYDGLSYTISLNTF